MMKVNSKVNLNMSVIHNLSRAGIEASEQTAEALHTEVIQAQVVPRMDGALQGESFFVDYSQSQFGKVSLVHAEPYARRLYFHPEYKFNKGPWEETIKHKDGSVSHKKHDGNPNAKGKWFEDWEPGGEKADFAPNAFVKFYKELTGL